MLKREDFSNERIEFLIQQARKHGPFEALTHEERETNRRQFLKCHAPDGDLWVFGYGSLIWNPAIHFEESRKARLYGYHRRFCLHLTIGRGSPENPGLMLALDRGGSCTGIAFRIKAEDVESETRILWMREMISGAYKPVWTSIWLAEKKIKGFTFVVNRQHPRYLGALNGADTVQGLKRGKGYLGSCSEYLGNTVAGLKKIGIRDRYLDSLWSQVSAENE